MSDKMDQTGRSPGIPPRLFHSSGENLVARYRVWVSTFLHGCEIKSGVGGLGVLEVMKVHHF